MRTLKLGSSGDIFEKNLYIQLSPEEAKCETCPRTETCEAIEQTYLEIPHPEDLPMMVFETVE